MKQSEWAAVILIAIVSLIGSYFIGTTFISSSDDRTAQIEQVNPISSDLDTPSEDIFNQDAINLTEIIEISESNTSQPFKN